MTADPSIYEVARAVQDGSQACLPTVEAILATIAAREPEIRAFLFHDPEQVLREAQAIDDRARAGDVVGPLAGVTVALKDNLTTEGTPTTCASKILEHWVPPYSATAVERLRAAGAIVIGKTNLDEFAMGSSTENSAFQVTKNPLDTTRVPGGSSGGSAAAVAARFAHVALGSDTGGSIRQPAALCGVVGFKPTYGLVSRYGLIAFASSLDQIGPFGRSVEDAGALFEIIAGHDSRDSTSLDRPAPQVLDRKDRGVEGLRVGVVADLVNFCSPDVVRRCREAADGLARAGALVEEVSVPATTLGLSAYYIIAPAEASSNLARFDGVRFGLREEGADMTETYVKTRSAGFGAEVKRRIMLGTYALSAGYYEAYYGKAQRVRTLIIRAFDEIYRRFDLLLCPTSPTTAFRTGDKANDPMAMYLNDVCTIPSSLAGHPAMSVPFGEGDDGLPVGVQLLGPALSDPLLFQAAFVLQEMANEHKRLSAARSDRTDRGGDV
ncbi:MAG: Asp-tRNA(Asn)/Glu-tRNA(Gln) amidotransferase subunit GatA [Acidimicrobiales bacterium]